MFAPGSFGVGCGLSPPSKFESPVAAIQLRNLFPIYFGFLDLKINAFCASLLVDIQSWITAVLSTLAPLSLTILVCEESPLL